MITTFEEACEFVLEHKVCTIFGSRGSPYPSLWDNVCLSEEKPVGGGWSEKVQAVWRWKNEIPYTFPDEVFYGKIPGGDAVLMEMNYLRTVHYPKAYQPVSQLDPLAQKIFSLIQLEPMHTGPLRKRAIEECHCTKSRFDTALKRLQISLNIVRETVPPLENDLWLPFKDVHLDIANLHR